MECEFYHKNDKNGKYDKTQNGYPQENTSLRIPIFSNMLSLNDTISS